MACKVNWTPKAWQTFEENISYLKENWTEKEVMRFVYLVDEKIINLSFHPKIGSLRSAKHPSIRFTLVHKRVALIYRYNPRKNQIELLVFWNTYQNPSEINWK